MWFTTYCGPLNQKRKRKPFDSLPIISERNTLCVTAGSELDSAPTFLLCGSDEPQTGMGGLGPDQRWLKHAFFSKPFPYVLVPLLHSSSLIIHPRFATASNMKHTS